MGCERPEAQNFTIALLEIAWKPILEKYMLLRPLPLYLLALAVSVVSSNAMAAEETLPPTRVNSPPASAETPLEHRGVRLEWLEFGLGTIQVEPAGAGSGKMDGVGGRLAGQVLLDEFTLLHAGAEHAISELAGQEDINQQQYFAGLAFAAPLSEYTRLLLETGWLREDFSQQGSIRQAEQGMYAAASLNFTLGNRVEVNLRSRGDRMFDRRRHDSEITLLLNVTNAFSVGLVAQVRHIATEDESRLYLVSRYSL